MGVSGYNSSDNFFPFCKKRNIRFNFSDSCGFTFGFYFRFLCVCVCVCVCVRERERERERVRAHVNYFVRLRKAYDRQEADENILT
jgi:hypothetical protein